MWKENNPEKGFCKLKKKQHKKGPFLFSFYGFLSQLRSFFVLGFGFWNLGSACFLLKSASPDWLIGH